MVIVDVCSLHCPPTALIALFALLVVLAAACGSGDDGTEGASDTEQETDTDRADEDGERNDGATQELTVGAGEDAYVTEGDDSNVGPSPLNVY